MTTGVVDITEPATVSLVVQDIECSLLQLLSLLPAQHDENQVQLKFDHFSKRFWLR